MVTITISSKGYSRYTDLLIANGISPVILLNSEGTASFTIEDKYFRKASDLWEIVRKEIWGH